jgi:hypothetical protein
MTDRALVLALSDTAWRGDDSAPARGFKAAGIASRERTITQVVERASSEQGEGR